MSTMRLAWCAALALVASAAAVPTPSAVGSLSTTRLVYDTMNDDGDMGVFSIRANGTGQQTVVPFTAPGYLHATGVSPDGTKVALVGEDNVQVVSTNGGARTPIMDWSSVVSGPIWSPDSSQLLLSTEVGGEEQLIIAEADGSDSHVVTTDADLDAGGLGPMAWSPNGSFVVVQAYRSGGVLTSWRVAADGNSDPVVWDGLVRISSSPVDNIAYAVQEEGAGLELVLLNGSLASPEPIRSFPDGALEDLTWSADGTQFAFIQFDAPADQTIWTFGDDGTLVRSWAALPSEGMGLVYTRLALSPDGSVMAFYASSSTGGNFDYEGLYMHDVSLNRSCQVVNVYDGLGAGLRPTFIPDGSAVLIEAGGDLASLDVREPGQHYQRFNLVGVPDFWGFTSETASVVDATPCARTKDQRDARVEWEKTKARWKLSAYVFARYNKCENQVPVRFERQKPNKTWAKVASKETNNKHAATHSVAKRGKYRVVVPAVIRGNYSCGATKSRPVKVV